MSEYQFTAGNMECDYFFQLPPKRILERCLDATLTDQHRDGCGLAELKEHFDAVWMISHMRITQSDFINPDDVITIRTTPRMEKRSCYFYYADLFRGEEQVARWECTYIPVYRVGHHILRLNLLEPLWNTPPMETAPSTMHRLRPDCEFVPCGSDTVRRSDCDKNLHMTSGAYLSLTCDALGYWESETPRLMRSIQVDFSSEVYPGTLLQFERGEADGVRYLRGIKPDGVVAFSAACEF